MANPDDYLSLLPQIEAISTKEIKFPYMSVAIYIQEADDLYHWCIEDKIKLQSCGLNLEFIDKLPEQINGLREAHALWKKAQRKQKIEEKEWKRISKESYLLKDTILRSFRFAFRNHKGLMKTTNEIAKGNTHADHIQDLLTCYLVGEHNHELLENISFDFSLLKKAKELSNSMGGLYASAKDSRMGKNPEKTTRDKFYTLLKLTVDEIKICGKYAFHNNPERLKGYKSDYIKRLNQKNRNSNNKEDLQN